MIKTGLKIELIEVCSSNLGIEHESWLKVDRLERSIAGLLNRQVTGTVERLTSLRSINQFQLPIVESLSLSFSIPLTTNTPSTK